MGIDIEQVQTVEKKNIKTDPVSQDQRPANNMPALKEPEITGNNQVEFDPELETELQVKLQPILLDSAINALGHTLAKLGKSDDLDFTQDEHTALVEAWAPLLPSVSPMTNAILVTVIILSGKALLYAASKKKTDSETKALPVESKEIKEAVN